MHDTEELRARLPQPAVVGQTVELRQSGESATLTTALDYLALLMPMFKKR